MSRIRDGLDLDSIPAPATLYEAFDRVAMAGWRLLLNVSLADLPPNGVPGIVASGSERAYASAQYTRRTNLTVEQLKAMMFVDTATIQFSIFASGQHARTTHRSVQRR